MTNFVPHLHPFPTNFGVVLKKSPPSAPPGLFSTLRRRATGPDKVRVAIRLLPKDSDQQPENGSRVSDEKVSICINDRRKQLTLQTAQIAPKIFNFDYIFNDEAAQAEVCASVLPSVLQTVVAGSDGCILCYGQPKTGKTYTMIGQDESLQTIGVVPAALSWLYRLIADNKSKYGTRYSIRASAYAITALGPSSQGATNDSRLAPNMSPNEPLFDTQTVFDLLEELEGKSASGAVDSSKNLGSNRNSPNLGFQHVAELKAPCVTRAAFLLDAAISRLTELYSEHKISESTLHFVFSLSIYQRRASHESNRGESSVRSRLLFIDLAGAVASRSSSDESNSHSPLYATLDPDVTSSDLTSSDVTSPNLNSQSNMMTQQNLMTSKIHQIATEVSLSQQKLHSTLRSPMPEDESNQDFNQYHSAMQNALLNLLNGGRTNFPCKLVSILREIFCGGSCRTVVIGHVSAGRPQHSELVKTVSFIAKLYRNKRPSNRSKHSGWSTDQWSPAVPHCSQLRAPSSNSCPEDNRSPFREGGFSSDANSEVPLGSSSNRSNTGAHLDENMKRLLGQTLISPCSAGSVSECSGGVSRMLHSSGASHGGSVSPGSQLIPSESSAFVPISRPHNVTVSTAQSVKFPTSNSVLAKPIPSYQLQDFNGRERRASLLSNPNSINSTSAQSDNESQYVCKKSIRPSGSNSQLPQNKQLSYDYRIGTKFLQRPQPEYSSDSERGSNHMTSASDTEVLEPRSNIMMGYLNASKLSLIEESEVAKINAFNDLRKRNMHLRNARPGTPQCKNRLLSKSSSSQQTASGLNPARDYMVQNRLTDLSSQYLCQEKGRNQKKRVSSVLFSQRIRSKNRKNHPRANSLGDSSASNANLWINSNTPYLPWRRLDYTAPHPTQNITSSQGSLASEGAVSSCFGLRIGNSHQMGSGAQKCNKIDSLNFNDTREKNSKLLSKEKVPESSKGHSNKRRKSFLQTIRKKLFGSASLPCSPLNSLSRHNETSGSKSSSIERKKVCNINPNNSGPSKNMQMGCSYPNPSQVPLSHNSPPTSFLNNPYENYHSIFYSTEGPQPAVKSMSRMGLSLNLQCNSLGGQQNPMSDSDSGIESLASSTNHKYNQLRGIINSRSFGHSYDSIADIRVTPHMNYPQQRLPQLPRSDSCHQYNNRSCSRHNSQSHAYFGVNSGHHSDQETDRRSCCSFQRYMHQNTQNRQTPQPLRSQTFVLPTQQTIGRFSCGHSAQFQEQWVDGFKPSNLNSSEVTASRKHTADQDPQKFAETLSQKLQHLKMK